MELENRKRRPHESLSDLMQDVRRLMVLGYGNDQGPMWESVAIKSFLSALDDPHLVIEIRKHRPATLDAAYQEALLLDGYYHTTPSERSDGDRGKRQDQARSARVDEEQNRQEKNWQHDMLEAQKSTTTEMQQIMKHVQRQWNEQRELLEMALRAPRVCERQVPHESGAGGPPPEASVDVDHVGRQPEGRPNQYRALRGRCHRCNEVGHFVRDCPQPDPRRGRQLERSCAQPPGRPCQHCLSTSAHRQAWLLESVGHRE